MIWPSIMPGLIYRTLKAFTHFSDCKQRENVLKNVGCKKGKLWAIFLPRVHLEKVANTWRLVYICKVFYMTVRIFRNTSLSILVFVNNNCCLCKCFTELYFLSWLLVVSFASFKIAMPFVFSRTWTSHAGVLKMPRVSNAFNDYT